MKFKFKGKTINDKWIVGDLITMGNKYAIRDWNTGEIFEVDANTVGQYIGLDDIHGNEIYVGDIIHVKGTGEIDSYPGDIPVTLDDDFVVVLDEEGILRLMFAGLSCDKVITDIYFLNNDFKIKLVGNIYDKK